MQQPENVQWFVDPDVISSAIGFLSHCVIFLGGIIITMGGIVGGLLLYIDRHRMKTFRETFSEIKADLKDISIKFTSALEHFNHQKDDEIKEIEHRLTVVESKCTERTSAGRRSYDPSEEC